MTFLVEGADKDITNYNLHGISFFAKVCKVSKPHSIVLCTLSVPSWLKFYLATSTKLNWRNGEFVREQL